MDFIKNTKKIFYEVKKGLTCYECGSEYWVSRGLPGIGTMLGLSIAVISAVYNAAYNTDYSITNAMKSAGYGTISALLFLIPYHKLSEYLDKFHDYE